MQIHAIHINHLLSFDTFAWEKLDPHLNVIVGPNGAGKTNLFHALRAVRDALSPERTRATAHWVNAGYQGTDVDTITVALDLQFITPGLFLCRTFFKRETLELQEQTGTHS